VYWRPMDERFSSEFRDFPRYGREPNRGDVG
jgi:hypothetical protein